MMNKPTQTHSLEGFFRRQTLRWAVLGFAISVCIAIPCILYSAKIAAERQAISIAQATAVVFRSEFIQNNIRDAEIQMRKSLELTDDDNAIFYAPNLIATWQAKQMALMYGEVKDIAHDLKAPLAGLKMGCRRLNDHPADLKAMAEAARVFPEVIEPLEQRLTTFFKYSSQNAAPSRMELRPVELVAFIRTLAERAQRIPGAEEVRIQVDTDQEAISLSVDHDKMASVFSNLFENSIQAAVQKTELEIRVLVKSPNWVNPRIEISVSDNGPGIPEEMRNRMFQPFATYGKKNGTGLGLELCKRYVEAHGGSIIWDQARVVGTEFVVSLPKEAR